MPNRQPATVAPGRPKRQDYYLVLHATGFLHSTNASQGKGELQVSPAAIKAAAPNEKAPVVSVTATKPPNLAEHTGLEPFKRKPSWPSPNPSERSKSLNHYPKARPAR
ncbi:hypothetical protein BBP40_007011 [Aspergillus hancockii]|nr:hypothetical protein BBP40_007011 [Aspergillus hancockii]